MLPGSRFVLRVPVDVSHVSDFSPNRRIQVVVWNKQISMQQFLHFNNKGAAVASFGFDCEPGSLHVALGPEAASPLELRHLQTTCVKVPPSHWSGANEVELPPIQVSTWDWWWWQHWRQNFRVTGRVVNSHGFPIAGATVSAVDVDAWWWWTAQEQVGNGVTDSDGCFAVDFTRCSGWWPWWWWVTRDWQIDISLIEMITSFTRRYPGLGLLAATASSPSLDIFQPLLAASSRPIPSNLASALSQTGHTIDPASLEFLRERLIEILPRRFPLPVWPWSEWRPWEDCGANLLFRVTQSHRNQTLILIEETIRDTRWDIPASFEVELTARESRLERRPDWTLVDYLFSREREPLAEGSDTILVPSTPGFVSPEHQAA